MIAQRNSPCQARPAFGRWLVAGLMLLALYGCDKVDRPPNILLILVDDLGFNDLGANNPGGVSHTPSLDQLAADGVRFTRHYSDVACEPSRASLLSGQYAARLGYRSNPRGISPDRPTLPKSLQAAGYQTHHIGKWLYWSATKPQPTHQGFDSYFGFLSNFQLSGDSSRRAFRAGAATYYNPWLETENGRQQHQGHLSDILAQNAIDKIKSFKDGQPWYINYWAYAPHLPIQPAKRMLDKYPDTPKGRYQALVNQLDTNIGLVLDALRDTGQAANTIVIVVSDNGGTNLAMDNNAPFNGSKLQFLEGGSRTPLLIRWPDHYPQGKVVSDVVALPDLFPTLAKAAGVDLDMQLDGDDISPLVLAGSQVQKPIFWEKYNFGRYDFGMLSSDGRWRLVTPRIGTGSIVRAREGNRTASPLQLYDLQSDPTGATDVAPTHTERVERMTQQYQQWHRQARRLRLTLSQVGDKTLHLSGDDYQRIPGYGGFTFGMSFDSPDPGSEDAVRLASQKGLWDIELANSDQLELSFADLKLAGKTNPGRNCHTAIFTTHIYNMGSKARPSVMALYVDGERAAETQFKPLAKYTGDFHQPTVVRSRSEGGVGDHTGLPIVLNTHVTALTPIKIEQLDAELCPETGSG